MRKILFFLLTICIVGPQCQKTDPRPKVRQLLTREVAFSSATPFRKKVLEFIYDEQNRCTSIFHSVIDSSLEVPLPVLSRTYTFFYTGNSTLPYKTTQVHQELPELVFSYYHTYDKNGLKIKDSISQLNFAGERGWTVIRYDYYKSHITSVPFRAAFSDYLSSYDTIFFDKSNITKIFTSMPLEASIVRRSVELKYDNNVNPYSVINLYNSLYFTNSTLGIGFNILSETHYMGLSQNNVTETLTGIGAKTLVIYEYDNLRYPVKSIWSGGLDFRDKRTTYYTYKSVL